MKNSRAVAPHPSKMYGFKRVVSGVKALIVGPLYARRRVIHELARIFAYIFGRHYVGDDYKLWRKEDGFLSKFRRLSPHNFFSEERKYALKEFTRSLRNVDGCIAECGSYVGVSSWFIANEFPDVDFYLFDSFEGLSKPVGFDGVGDGIQEWKRGDLKTSEEILRGNLVEFGKIHILKGWIPDRFPDVSHLNFRLVHIDVDLYQPTLDSLMFFYPRLNPGGMILMDDYGFENCPGAYKAAEDFMRDKPETIIHLPTGQGLIIRACPSSCEEVCSP